MKINFRNRFLSVLSVAAAILGCYSCVDVDTTLGADYLPTIQQFDFYTAEFDLEDIEMKMADSLSGYSNSRITIGTVRDDLFGLTRKGCVLTLIPQADSMDFGKNPVFKDFLFSIEADTTSAYSEIDQHILQNINVYELTEPLDSTYDVNATIKHGSKRITKGIPVYDGKSDTLNFHFTKEFGEKFFEMTTEDTKDIETYTKKYPGIYLETDDPIGMGGRINMFLLQVDYNSNYNYIGGNYAELTFSAEYDGEVKDTSFVFYFGADKIYPLDSLLYNTAVGSFPQYALNVCHHETRSMAGKAKDKIYVEGGGGLKPVISASEIREKMIAEISKHGNPQEASINKASIIMPFEFPDDYTEISRYPQILSPTCRIRSNNVVSYGGLTDSSASDEDQGDIDRSNLDYSPDITYHAQALLGLEDLTKINNYDIWFLIVANEVEKTGSSAAESDELTEYYQNLMYSSYYNNMYGGYGYGGYGYGGYGSYGGYGYGNDYYSNYYSYMLMQQYYNSSTTTTESYTTALDKDRFYKAVLRGPEDKTAHPTLKITYAIPRD